MLLLPQAKGVPLASNQVQYSLLYRVPERNGVADAVKAAGATLIAYSPLAQGLLTGAPGSPVTCHDRVACMTGHLRRGC
jgi:aryl-alcohol dehydrogenase-like predicted oxidoreductase